MILSEISIFWLWEYSHMAVRNNKGKKFKLYKFDYKHGLYINIVFE